MKKFGIALISLGIFCALLAFNMSVIIGTIYNIGLLNERQNVIYLSGIIFLAGIILFGFGVVAKEESKNIKAFVTYAFLIPLTLLITIKIVDIQEQKKQAEVEEERRFKYEFVDNQDGTITHKASRLIWQKCSVGQTWNGSVCDGEAKKISWKDAMQLKSNLMGKNDWRLPNIEEAEMLIYCSDDQYDTKIETYGECVNKQSIDQPTINSKYFPQTPNEGFWSSSKFSIKTNEQFAFTLDFSTGSRDAARTESYKDYYGNEIFQKGYIRLVRREN